MEKIESKPNSELDITTKAPGDAHESGAAEKPATEPPKAESPSPDVSGENGNPKNEQQENTRSKLALLFVLGFFAVLFLCFVYAILVEAELSELKDILVGVIGALAGIFGFIVGYYYKSSKE